MTSQVLPTITSPTTTITAEATVVTEQKQIITNVDIDSCEAAIKAYKLAGKKQRDAEKQRDEKLLAVASKLFGCKTLDEFRLMSPAKLNEVLGARAAAGLLSFEPHANEFVVDNEKDCTKPAWKDIAIKLAGEVKAMEEAAKTPKKYSYVILRKKK